MTSTLDVPATNTADMPDGAIYEYRDRRALAWHGLTPTSHSRACVRLLWGGRHRPSRCDCEGIGPLNDHPRLWTDRMGHRVLTLEPYNASPDALAHLEAWARGLGISVEMSDRSMWNPGQTVLIVLRTDPAIRFDKRRALILREGVWTPVA